MEYSMPRSSHHPTAYCRLERRRRPAGMQCVIDHDRIEVLPPEDDLPVADAEDRGVDIAIWQASVRLAIAAVLGHNERWIGHWVLGMGNEIEPTEDLRKPAQERAHGSFAFEPLWSARAADRHLQHHIVREQLEQPLDRHRLQPGKDLGDQRASLRSLLLQRGLAHVSSSADCSSAKARRINSAAWRRCRYIACSAAAASPRITASSSASCSSTVCAKRPGRTESVSHGYAAQRLWMIASSRGEWQASYSSRCASRLCSRKPSWLPRAKSSCMAAVNSARRSRRRCSSSGVERSIARRVASGSSNERIVKISSSSSCECNATRAPRCGRISTSPWACNSRKASRTGVGETPSRAAHSSSRRRSPGFSSLRMIAVRKASDTRLFLVLYVSMPPPCDLRDRRLRSPPRRPLDSAAGARLQLATPQYYRL